MVTSDLPPCEECETTERRRTRNRDEDGTRRVLCDQCLRELLAARRRADIQGETP
jgi:hypothetical protein